MIYGNASGFATLDMLSFTSSDSTGYIIQGAEAGDLLGYFVSGAGDVNGDGCDDVIVGAPEASPNARSEAGAAYVIISDLISVQPTALPTVQPTVQPSSVPLDIDLAALDTNNILALSVLGAAAEDWLGRSVSAAGDVNGDGYGDVIVGAYGADPNNRDKAGAAYVIFGMASGFANFDLASFTSGDSSGYIIQGAAAYDNLGFSVSGAGDVNGDGFDDVVVGALAADPNGRSAAGAAYVIFGKASGFATLDTASFTSGDSSGYIMQGAAANDYLGYRVSGAGDVNNDGYDDVVVGAVGADPNSRVSAGAAYVIFGKAGGLGELGLGELHV
jgi:hypothetical protein